MLFYVMQPKLIRSTTVEEIKQEIQFLHLLIYHEISWANHIGVSPCSTRLDNLYAEIAEWEAKLK